MQEKTVQLRYRLLAIGLLLLVTVEHVYGASLPEVILAGTPSFEGQLAALGEGMLRFTTVAGEPREVAAGTFVRWSHPRDPVRRPRVLLTGGSQLVADLSWTTDGSVQLAGDQMQVRTGLLGRVSLPRGTIRAVLFDAARDPIVASRVLREIKEATSRTQDEIWLASGDRLSGDIVAIDGAIATLKLPDQSIDVPLSNLSAVAFRQPAEPQEPARWALGLADGTLLRASTASGDQQRFQAKLAVGVEVTGKSLRDVAFLQNLSSDRFVYLSDLEAIDYKHTPYFDLTWPLAVNENLLGQPLRSANQRYPSGISMHTASRAVYRLTGDERLLESTIALDDVAGRGGSVIFRAYAVRDGKPELAFESNIVRGGDAPTPISVDIAGAQGLVLVVDYADYGDERDHANWLDARIVR